MPSHNERASHVRIQLGPPSSSSNPHSIKKRSRPTHTKRHRAHVLNEESESDSGGEQSVHHEAITTYGSDASDDSDQEQERGSNGHRSKRHKQEHRKSESQRRQEHAPGAVSSNRDREVAGGAEQKPVKWGLTFNMKVSGGGKDRQESESRRERTRAASEKRAMDGTQEEEKYLDDEVLDALVGASSKKPKFKPSDPSDPDDEPGVEEYRAVPIDDFGATLLRSFGWDGQMKGKVKEVTKHANLTGLGAKDAKGAEDLGSWNQKVSKDPRPVRLGDYQREQREKRRGTEERHRDSYKEERERERRDR